MKRQPHSVRWTTLALVAFLGIMLAFTPTVILAQGKDATKQATKFRQQGEDTRKSIEKARDQLKLTVEAYDALLASDEKKLQGAHKKLVSEIDKMEKVVDSGRKQVTSFKEMAEQFFVGWGEQLESISTDSIRSASEKRLAAAKVAFQNMSENLSAAGEAYDPLIGSLKEQATLVAQDLTLATVGILEQEAAPDVHAKAEQVFASIEASLSKEAAEESEMNAILEEEEAESPAPEGEAETAEDSGGDR